MNFLLCINVATGSSTSSDGGGVRGGGGGGVGGCGGDYAGEGLSMRTELLAPIL